MFIYRLDLSRYYVGAGDHVCCSARLQHRETEPTSYDDKSAVLGDVIQQGRCNSKSINLIEESLVVANHLSTQN